MQDLQAHFCESSEGACLMQVVESDLKKIYYNI